MYKKILKAAYEKKKFGRKSQTREATCLESQKKYGGWRTNVLCYHWYHPVSDLKASSSSLFLCLIKDLLAPVLALYMLICLALLYLFHQLCIGQESIRKKLWRQGVRGPEPALLCGNTKEMKRIQKGLRPVRTQDANDYTSTLFPHFLLWRKIYGTGMTCGL